jgi:hypothetical protein
MDRSTVISWLLASGQIAARDAWGRDFARGRSAAVLLLYTLIRVVSSFT